MGYLSNQYIFLSLAADHHSGSQLEYHFQTL
uniref:Uncharacterized protein n=1 Tax=Arundo donax TaxID=35708 RepID=A0A0A9HRT4_ARUDO